MRGSMGLTRAVVGAQGHQQQRLGRLRLSKGDIVNATKSKVYFLNLIKKQASLRVSQFFNILPLITQCVKSEHR